MRPKYLLCPGEIRSKNDGDFHYISAGRLIALYGVKASECTTDYRGLDGLIPLEPRYQGDYQEWLKQVESEVQNG